MESPDKPSGQNAALPFASHYYQRPDGLKLHYLDEGHGPAVVMLHGNPSWSFLYRRLISALAPRHRCLAPDHLGMGLSDRPKENQYAFRLQDRIADLSALMEHWRIDGPVHLAAHDWGGPIALGWAVENPHRVASLTLMNTALRQGPGYSLPLRLKLFRLWAPLGELLARRFNLFAWGTAFFGSKRGLSPEAWDGFLAPYKRPEDRLALARFVADIPLSPGHPSWELLKSIDRQVDEKLAAKPLALVWGLRDFVFNRRLFLDWRARFPQAPALILPEAGHYLMEDAPEPICAFIAKFIEGIQP